MALLYFNPGSVDGVGGKHTRHAEESLKYAELKTRTGTGIISGTAELTQQSLWIIT